MPHLPTFSNVARAMECTASATLDWTDEVSGPKAEHGNIKHAELCGALLGKKKAPFDFGAITDFMVKGDIQAEPAFAYDPDSDNTKFLGLNIGRAYGDLPLTHFCGALDAAAQLEDTGTIVDLKTGTTAPSLWQLQVQAVAYADYYELDRVRAAFAYLPEGSDTVKLGEVYEWGIMDLDGFAEELSQLKKRILNGAAIPREGVHCQWCKAYAACPAKSRLAISLSRNEPSVLQTVGSGTQAITKEIAAPAWEALIQAEQLLKHVRDKLEGYAVANPFELSDGSVVKAVPGNETIKSEVAFQVLNERYGMDTAYKCGNLKVSKQEIRKALRNGEADKAIEAIRQAGGINRGSQVKAVKK